MLEAARANTDEVYGTKKRDVHLQICNLFNHLIIFLSGYSFPFIRCIDNPRPAHSNIAIRLPVAAPPLKRVPSVILRVVRYRWLKHTGYTPPPLWSFTSTVFMGKGQPLPH